MELLKEIMGYGFKMLIDKEECIKQGKHNTKIFKSCMPSKEFCDYCMTEVRKIKFDKKTCTVNGCYDDCQEGDLYFCKTCRQNWLKFLGDIAYIEMNEADKLILLNKFRKEGLR